MPCSPAAPMAPRSPPSPAWSPTDEQLPPLQRAFTERHGFQCGFCTAGILISIFAEATGRSKQEVHDRHARRPYLPLHRLREHPDGPSTLPGTSWSGQEATA